MNIIETNLNFGKLSNLGEIKRIICHNADASTCTIQDIDRWHKNNGWAGCGYHFFVRKDGSIYRGRPEDKLGAHTSNYNTGSLGICFEGKYNNEEMPEAQLKAGQELIKYLLNKYNLSKANVYKHKDFNNTDCPGNKFPWDKIIDFNCINTIISNNVGSKKEGYSEYANYVGTRCKELQSLLISLGYNCGGYGADGIFGKGTYESLIQFQKDNGLKIDGLAGPNTFDNLYELVFVNDSDISFNFEKWVKDLQTECNRQGFSKQKVDGDPGDKTLKGCPTLRKGAEGNITKLAQERLISLGYDLGKHGADGDFETATYNAVIKFQKDYGLSTDGIVGQNTWRKLLNL